MTSAPPTVPATPGRDSMREQRSVVAGLAWALGWTAGLVAIVVTALSAASAVKLAGVPDPGWITTYGLPAVTAIGEVAAAIAVGSAVFAAFFVPPQADGVLDVGGYRAIRLAASASLVWAVCAVLMIPLSISNVSGQPLSETLQPTNLLTAYSQVADARTWLWTAIFAVAAAALARVVLRWGWTVAVLAITVLSLMPVALAGHSSTGGNHDLATNSLILHIVAASVWMG
ncbi:MAG: copper resistance protein CopD, partial [Actinomycetota bacterium]|nr:copper resistance protein CopD [Actinomycetota bacterium]